MVFESLVVDLLNKHLGNYVKNLDASQLKIGIWGGDVVLTNLELKDTALQDLDLPIKVVKGFLGKLTLQIPWKNLYTEPTIVRVDDLHLLAKPNFDIKYDEEKEEIAKLEKKKKEIENIEEARLNEELKRLGKKEKTEDEDSFSEKLATSVVKNLQITIQNIHVRYEDSVSDPDSPFSIGVTLENLSAETTDENFQPQIIKDAVTIIHKLIRLDNLAVYWNPKDLFKEMSTEDWLVFSRERIACYKSSPIENNIAMNYIIQPIVASKKMKINTKPGLDNTIPKFFLSLVLEELSILLMRKQYHSMIELVDSIERMQKNQPYRKYRPYMPVHGNTREWWTYCISSILEEDVRRIAKMWSWEYIKEHRLTCKQYKVSYKAKLLQKNPSKELLTSLDEMEQKLNVVSVTIFRQLAENEVARLKKMRKSPSKSKSWFGGLFSSSSSKKDLEKLKSTNVFEEFLPSVSEREKEMQKLYQAIGYTENEVITPFPADYVALVFKFQLNKITIKCEDDTRAETLDVTCFTLNRLNAEVLQRPSSKGLKVSLKIEQLKLLGTPCENKIPLLVKSCKKDDINAPPLVHLCFEINPIGKDVDQSIKVICQPLELVYDAKSISSVFSFFEPPEEVVLQNLQEKAYMTFEDFKVTSTTGLLYAMEQRNILDVDIYLNASYLIIPDKGSYFNCKDMIVIDFGSLKLESDPTQVRLSKTTGLENVKDIQENAYDRFLLNLSALQVLICKEGEDIHHVRSLQNSQSHILHPVAFVGKIAKAIIPEDPRLKQLSIFGELPSLEVTVSDDKISRIVKLFDSLPMPQLQKEKSPEDETKAFSTYHNLNYTDLIIPEDIEITIPLQSTGLPTEADNDKISNGSEVALTRERSIEEEFSSGIVNQIKVELQFEIKKLKLAVALTDKELLKEKDCISVNIDDINCELKVRRWDLFFDANIGHFLLMEMTQGTGDKPLKVLKTETDTKMLKISYRQCGFNEAVNLGVNYLYSAEYQVRALQYREEFESVEKQLEIEVCMLFVKLHQEALLSIMAVIHQVLEPFSAVEETGDVLVDLPLKRKLSNASDKIQLKRRLSTASDKINRLSASRENLSNKQKVPKSNQKSDKIAREMKEKVGLSDGINLKVVAKMAGVDVHVCSEKIDLTQATVTGLSAQIKQYEKRLEVEARMTDLHVYDRIEHTKYPDIISMQSEEVFALKVEMFEDGTKAERSLDMSSVDTIIELNVGQMKTIYLSRFIQDILSFMDHFESAKKAIIDASEAARKKAADVVNELHRHSQRHKFDLTLHAPTIVVPVDSKSVLAIFVYLGKLHVYNTFKIVNKEDKGSRDFVITDNINISLTQLKLSKALYCNDKVIAQRDFIEPMTLQLDIIRNLTFESHLIPDINVQGSLNSITLYLSEEDIKVIVKVLRGNFSEGQISFDSKKRSKKEENEVSPVSKISMMERKVSRLELPSDSKETLGYMVSSPVNESSTYIKTSFSFDLDNVVMKVYLKPTDIPFEDEFLERDEELSLSEFTIGHLSVAGNILSNEEMNVSVLLKTLILDDKRLTSRGNLIRMVDYCPKPLLESTVREEENNMTKGMLELDYKLSATSDQFINIHLSNLLCILNMEFLQVLTTTLMAAIPDGNMVRGDSTMSIASSTYSIESGYEDSDNSTSDSMDSVDEELVSCSELKVIFDLQNPQIVLLADARDPKTNALFLTTKINFQYLYLKYVQKMLMTVSKTSIVSTAFQKENRSDMSSVLFLEAINLYSSAPINGKPHMHISMTSVDLCLSPLTMHTVTASIKLATAYKANEESVEMEKAFSKLWELNNITEKKSWYLNIPAQHVLSAGSFVLARNEDGVYKNGFLSKKDTHFTVFFYPEGQISHSVFDITSVVVDMAPKEDKIMVGTNVLAIHSEVGYKIGQVARIWQSKKVSNGSNESALPNNEWQMETSDGTSTEKYLIHFYHDDSECYLTSAHIRILPSPIKGIVPGIGASVYARFKDGSYYKGIIKSIHGYQNQVYLDEIDEKITHDRDDTAAIILNISPPESQLKKLFKVIAKRSKDSKGFHPGKILTIMGNPGYYSYYIKFEDGTTNQVTITDIRLMPKAPYDALPEIGSYVYSRTAQDSPLYEKGIVADKTDRIYVNHLSGRKISHGIQNIGFVIRNIVPLNISLMVGQNVIGQVDSDDHYMHTGVIKEVILGAKFKKYLIEFSDGTEKKLTAGRIRILSTYGGNQTETDQTDVLLARTEQLVVEVERISLYIQGYLGGVLTSMLHFDSKLKLQVSDWSEKLNGNVNLSLTSTYYNDLVAEWEPLVEPITENNRERNWELNIKYLTEDDDVHSSTNSVSDDTSLLQKPMSSLTVTSYDNLNLTLTKESISLLRDLAKVFSSTVEVSDVVSNVDTHNYPYVIYNKLGRKVTVQMNELLKGMHSEKEITLDCLSHTGLEYQDDVKDVCLTFSRKLPTISVQVEGYQEIKSIVIKRHRVVLYNLVPINILSGEPYSVVIQVEVIDGRRFISIRSPLQIKNNFPIPLEVSYMNNDQMTKLTTIDARTKYAVPLLPAYNSKFHLTPAGFGYHESIDALDWTRLETTNEKHLLCLPTEEREPFYIQAVIENDTYTSIHGMLSAVPHYIINCYPPIILHNYLPYGVLYKSKGMAKMEKLEGGKSWPLFTVNIEDKPVMDIIIEDYMGFRWVGSVLISGTKGKTSRFIPLTLKSEENKKLDLGLFQLQEGTLNVTFYSPYWMLNKTGQALIYQGVGNEVQQIHPESFLDPVMFQVKAKKKKARLAIQGCNWSDEFSVDTVGSGGSLESAGVRGRIFEIGVRISLSNFALTKIVTFTPLRMINNRSKYTISMAEADSETAEWHTVKPDASIPYWPTCLPPRNLYINIFGIDSVQFNPEPGKSLLLRFQNEIGGICVTYQEKDSSSLLSFDTYFPGAAPARIENMCKQITMISYKQNDFYRGHVLLYGQSVLYTWDDPTKTQELVCGIIESNESQTKIKLDKNDFGRMKTGNSMIYWVSFLDGIQRVLLFTDNFKAAYYASQEHILRPSQEVNISIESVGISLVNAEKRLEVGYFSIRKSPIVWEKARKNRWKKLENKMSVALEMGFNNYHGGKISGKTAKIKVLDVEVDYEKMFITKPEKVKIQRIFHSGIEFKYTLFPNRMSISGSISTLQVDSHIAGSTFLTIVHIVEPPMSVARDNVPQPFIQFTLITKLGEKNVVNEVNYFKILVQEMDIRIDTVFLYALMDLFTNEETKDSEIEQYKADLLFVGQRLESSPEFQATKQEKRYVFNYFHVSPLKIHVSFSWIGGQAVDDDSDGSSMSGDILSLLLQSVGLAITEIQDVEFKLACYEINSNLLSSSQLSEGISKHYQTQAIKQLYVLVLGLDVLGNPYELITGVGAGAKNLFYEPYQGLIQGPEEFAEGLAYGVKSLVGGTVGGVSGAVSKITGTVGKGLAALTMDDEYKQKRRQAMSQRPTNLGQGLAKGGKGLFKGIVSGVTGIVTKPIEGAKAEGAEGFFKGIGKGDIFVFDSFSSCAC